MPGALDGILVVSVEQAVAAPYASSRLADGGARVIKIERPDGDFARDYDRVAKGQSAYFVWLNRGKESLALDIKDPDDAALLHRMVEKADVFIQNLSPGAAARAGLLIRDFEAAERAGSIRAIAFDKTGTLTEGAPKLVSTTPAPGFAADDMLRLAASAQAGSEHPLAQATVDAAGGAAQPPESFEARPGQGLVAKVQGQIVAIGSANLMVAEGIDLSVMDAAVATAAEGGCSIAFVAIDGALAGLLAFRDEPRAGQPLRSKPSAMLA